MLVAALWSLAGPMACASRSRDGFYYTVEPGDNLYRLGLRFGVSPDVLIEVNRIEERSHECHAAHHDGNEQRGLEHLPANALGFAQHVHFR